jgi:hypothetical protein
LRTLILKGNYAFTGEVAIYASSEVGRRSQVLEINPTAFPYPLEE